jgi:hypothetical protein
MSSESKILTVSYGTFSCTLEGYDDPFVTMKAIAEYFRDLSTEDRYFGSVPPQPDAAMLHRIAEREVNRLIDGKAGDTPGGQERQAGRASGRSRGARDGIDAARSPSPPPEPTVQDVIPAGVAAKLARIRQSVTPQAIAATFADGAAPVQAADTALEAVEALLRAPDAGLAEAEGRAPVADDAGPEARAFFAGDGLVAAINLAPAPFEPATDDDALATIEALADAPEEDYEEARDVAPDEVLDLDATEAPWGQDDAADAAAARETESIFRLTEADVTAAFRTDPKPALGTIVDPLPEDMAADEGASGYAPPDDMPLDWGSANDLRAGDLGIEDPNLAQAFEPPSETSGQAPQDPSTAPDLIPPSATLGSPMDRTPPIGKTVGKTKRVSSRVVRIHPDEEPDLPADPKATRILRTPEDEGEVARLIRQAEEVMADEENRRRTDSIAQLRAAVAATEAERHAAGKATRPDKGPDSEAPEPDVPAAPPTTTEAAQPRVKSRRKTVSVRPEEGRASGIRSAPVNPTPLVLVSEQRIDRVTPTAVPTYSPAALTPAITAPGIGVPGGAGKTPLRTGRLTGAIGVGAAKPVAALAPQSMTLDKAPQVPTQDYEDEDDLDEVLSAADTAGLARFAERVGVKSIADMLEAAAAYATCIEGRDRFTRPQLMQRLVATAAGKPVSREEGLRSFGTLLRTGRIEKISRGHYVLAAHSPYLAEARRIG